MKINCLSCGHKVDLGDAYGNYTGPVKCMVCGVILQIKTEEESVKAVAIATQRGFVRAETSELPVGAEPVAAARAGEANEP